MIYMVLTSTSAPEMDVSSIVSLGSAGFNTDAYCVMLIPQSAEPTYYQFGPGCSMFSNGGNFRMQFVVETSQSGDGRYLLMPTYNMPVWSVGTSGNPTVTS